MAIAAKYLGHVFMHLKTPCPDPPPPAVDEHMPFSILVALGRGHSEQVDLTPRPSSAPSAAPSKLSSRKTSSSSKPDQSRRVQQRLLVPTPQEIQARFSQFYTQARDWMTASHARNKKSDDMLGDSNMKGNVKYLPNQPGPPPFGMADAAVAPDITGAQFSFPESETSMPVSPGRMATRSSPGGRKVV